MKKLVVIMLSVFMSLALVCGSGSLLAQSIPSITEESEEHDEKQDMDIDAQASGYWIENGNTQGSYVSSRFSGGDGSESSPYWIGTAAQLARLAWLVNCEGYNGYNGTYIENYSTKHYKLSANIDLSSHYWVPIGVVARNLISYDQINDTANHKFGFSGTFDGNGYSISGMTISLDDSALTETNNNVGLYGLYASGYYNISAGLFGCVKNGGKVKNVELINPIITSTATKSANNVFIGGIAGMLQNESTVSSCDIKNCAFKDESENLGYNFRTLAGVVGHAFNSDIYDCRVGGNIQSNCDTSNNHVSGICGSLESNTSRDCTIKNCFNKSIVWVDSYGDRCYVGGIVGAIMMNQDEDINVFNCVNNGGLCINNNSSSGKYVTGGIGGIIGYCYSEYYGILNASYNSNYGNITVQYNHELALGGIIGLCWGYESMVFSNVNFGDVYSLYGWSGTGDQNGVGGIVGDILGRDDTKYQVLNYNINYGKVTATRPSGKSYSFKWTGGIAGRCYAGGKIIACVNYGNVSGNTCVGGIIGEVGSDNYLLGFIDQSNRDIYVINCINYGTLTALTSNYGAIYGYSSGHVYNCYSASTSKLTGYSNKSDNVTLGTLSKTASLATIQSKTWNTSYSRFNRVQYSSYGPASSYVLNYSTAVYNYFGPSASSRGVPELSFVPSSALASMSFSVRYIKEDENGEEKEYIPVGVKISNESCYKYNPTTKGAAWMNYQNDQLYLRGADYSTYSSGKYLVHAFQPKNFTFESMEISNSFYVDSETTLKSASTSQGTYRYLEGCIFPEYHYENPNITPYYNNVNVKIVYRSSYVSNITPQICFKQGSTFTDDTSVGAANIYHAEGKDKYWFQDTVAVEASPTVGYKLAGIYTSKNVNTNILKDEDGDYIIPPRGDYKYEYKYRLGYSSLIVAFEYVDYNVEFYASSPITSEASTTLKETKTFATGHRYTFDSSTYDYMSDYGFEHYVYVCTDTSFFNNKSFDYSKLEEDFVVSASNTNASFVKSSKEESLSVEYDEILEAIRRNPLTAEDNKLESLKVIILHKPVEYTMNIVSKTQSITKLDVYETSTTAGASTFNNGLQTLTGMIAGQSSPITINLKANEGYILIENSTSFVDSRALPTTALLTGFQEIDGVFKATFNFDDLLNAYMEYYKSTHGGNYDPNNDTINIYTYYLLDSYDFNFATVVDGEIKSGAVDAKITTNENNSTKTYQNRHNFSDGKINVHNSATITLSANNVEGYDFVGFYRVASVDSLDEIYKLTSQSTYEFTCTQGINFIASYVKQITYETTELTPNKFIYTISSAQDLLWLSKKVNSGEDFHNYTFNQTCNIDMAGIKMVPIGTIACPFAGVYNGNNYTISNLSIDRDGYLTGSSYYQGLFGCTDGAIIRNLTIDSGKVQGYGYVGAFVGYAKNSTFINISNNVCEIVGIHNVFYDLLGMTSNKNGAIASGISEGYVGGIVGLSQNCTFSVVSSRTKVSFVNEDDLSVYSGSLDELYVGNLIGGVLMDNVVDQCFVDLTLVENIQIGNLIANLEDATVVDCYICTDAKMTYLGATIVAGSDVVDQGYELDPEIWGKLGTKIVLRAFYWN